MNHSKYTRATLSDGSRVVLYAAGNQGMTCFYWVSEVVSGPASIGASVARERGTTRFYYREQA